MPIITLSRKEIKPRQNLWLTKDILESIRIKNQLYKKYIKNKYNFWFERCNFCRNKVSMLISKSKKKYLRKIFQEVEDNSKKIRTKINYILNKKCNAKNNIFLSENGQIITNQSLVVNKFNKYLVNVFQNLLKSLRETNIQFQDDLKNSNEYEGFSQ